MALFGSSKEEVKKGAVTGAIRSPRITEKATLGYDKGSYVFNVSPRATAQEVAKEIAAIYNVKPVKVNMVTIRPKIKRNARTGRPGVIAGGKKAYVFLKKGDSITLM
jgi:large subunit ribosomal protein L23